MNFKTLYKPHQPRKYSTTITEESLTQQQFKAECDVNNILAKYKKTGMITHLSKHKGEFGDFSNVEDYQTSLARLDQAHQSFQMLPAELRAKFHNDPKNLIAFLSDSSNDEEAIKYGLKTKPTKEPSIQEQMEKALENNDTRRQKNKTPNTPT